MIYINFKEWIIRDPEKLNELLDDWANYVKDNGVIENVPQKRQLQNDALEPFDA